MGAKLEMSRNWSYAHQVSWFRRNTTLFMVSWDYRNDEVLPPSPAPTAPLDLPSSRLVLATKGMKWVSLMFVVNKEIKYSLQCHRYRSHSLSTCTHSYRDFIVESYCFKNVCLEGRSSRVVYTWSLSRKPPVTQKSSAAKNFDFSTTQSLVQISHPQELLWSYWQS